MYAEMTSEEERTYRHAMNEESEHCEIVFLSIIFVFINFVFYYDKLSNRSNILKKQQQKLSGNRQIRSFRIIVFGEPHLPFFGICSGQMTQHRVRVVKLWKVPTFRETGGVHNARQI